MLAGIGLLSVLMFGGWSEASHVAAGASPNEQVGILPSCIGNPHSPVVYPLILADLYNVPSGATPTASGTVSDGANTTSFSNISLNKSMTPTGQPAYTTVLPVPQGAAAGDPLWVTITWADGLGGGGSSLGPQLVGLPPVFGVGQGGPQLCGPSPSGFSYNKSAMAAMPDGLGYWTVSMTGAVAGFGQAYNFGDLSYVRLQAPIVGIAATPDGEGYWLIASDGGVFGFGSAKFFGSAGGLRLNAPIVGAAASPDGGGYWLVASDGGVFAYGDANFEGSMGGQPLNRAIVGMVVDQATGGYWLVAADGGVFSFNAAFHGSTGGLVLAQPIIGMQAAPDGSGYRLAARDGGVFSFDLPFAGSYAGRDFFPMAAISGEGNGGYWLLDSCGGIFSFGSAPFLGSQPFTC